MPTLTGCHPTTRTIDPPPFRGPVIIDQYWDDLVFLHWRVEPAVVAPFLPTGLPPRRVRRERAGSA